MTGQKSIAESDVLVAGKRALRSGDRAGALPQIEAFLAEHPCSAEAWHCLASAKSGDIDLSASIDALREAVRLNAFQSKWHVDLAELLFARAEYEAAETSYDAALKLDPACVDALFGKGHALLRLKQYAASARCFRSAVELSPSAVQTRLGLALALHGSGSVGEAIDVLLEGLRYHPQDPELHRMAGRFCMGVGDFDGALVHLEASAAASGRVDREFHVALTRIKWEIGDVGAAIRHARAAMEDAPAIPEQALSEAYLSLYDEAQDGQSLRRAAEAAARRLPRVCLPPPIAIAVAGRRIRIGYLSGDLTGGPPFHFLSSFFAHHDQRAFEITCYRTRTDTDSGSEWYRRRFRSVECGGWSTKRIVDRIRHDEIDILVDLSGLLPGHRLDVFASRAAAIQICYPNCPGTTGVPEMDYIFTDRRVCPEGLEAMYSEQPLFLEGGYLAYTPPNAPEIQPAPFLRNGYITFGIFQKLAKISEASLDAMAEVLRECWDSQMLIHCSSNCLRNPQGLAVQTLLDRWEARGVARNRIRIEPPTSHAESLALLGDADIALDTLPFQGQTTTCDCLWMGVPVATLEGRHHVARVGTSVLRAAMLPQLIATTPRQYVEIAVALARDTPRLIEFRATIRGHLLATPLLSGQRLARAIERHYTELLINFQETKAAGIF